MIQEIIKKLKRKVTLIIVVILGMLAELLQDKLGSVLRRKFRDPFMYSSEEWNTFIHSFAMTHFISAFSSQQQLVNFIPNDL